MAVVGQLLPKRFPFEPLEFSVANARQFGDIAYYHVGPLPVYHIAHPDLVRQVLVEDADKFHKARLIKRAQPCFTTLSATSSATKSTGERIDDR